MNNASFQEVNIGNIRLTLQGDVFYGLRNLKNLVLQKTSLTEMPYINSDVCQSLESLRISYNLFDSIVESISYEYFNCFAKLKRITFRATKIQQSPNIEGVRKSLESLDMASNNISNIDTLTEFVYPKLSTLKLDENPITHINIAHALTYMWPAMSVLSLRYCELQTIDNLLEIPKQQGIWPRTLYLEGDR